MYKLYWSPGSAAMAVQATLEETGAPYELIRLDLSARDHDKADYKKLNPNGRVPTLIDTGGNGEDFVIFETAAICLYLADKHPEVNLAPPLGTEARGRCYQWLVHLTNTVQATFMDFYHPDWTMKTEAGQTALKEASNEKLQQQYNILEAAIGPDAPHMLGTQFTICDIFLAMLARWSRNLPANALGQGPMWLGRPNIRRVVQNTISRQTFRDMMQKQGITWPENW